MRDKDPLTWLHQTVALVTSGNVIRKYFIYKAKGGVLGPKWLKLQQLNNPRLSKGTFHPVQVILLAATKADTVGRVERSMSFN